MLSDLFQGNNGDYSKLNFKVPGEKTLAQLAVEKRKEKKLADKAEKKAARQKAIKSLFTWNISLPSVNLDGLVHRFVIGTNAAEEKTSPFSEEDQAMLQEQEALLAREMAAPNKDNPPIQTAWMKEEKASQNRDKRIGFSALSIGLGVCVLGFVAVNFINVKRKAILPVKHVDLKKRSDKHHNDTVFMMAQKDLFETKHKYDTLYSKQVNELDREFQDKDSSYSLSRDFASDSMHIAFKEDSVRFGNAHPGLIFSLSDEGRFLVQGKIKDSLYPMHNSKLQYVELKK